MRFFRMAGEAEGKIAGAGRERGTETGPGELAISLHTESRSFHWETLKI